MLTCSIQEAQTKKIDLPDDDLHAVECMISFMYTGDYDSEKNDIPHTPTEKQPAKLEQSQATSSEQPKDDNVKAPTTTADGDPTQEFSVYGDTRVYILADKYDISLLKRLARRRVQGYFEANWDLENFPKTLREIFESVPSHCYHFKKLISEIITSHCGALIVSPEIWRVIRDSDSFGWGIVSDISTKNGELLAEVAELKDRIDKLECKSTARDNWGSRVERSGSWD